VHALIYNLLNKKTVLMIIQSNNAFYLGDHYFFIGFMANSLSVHDLE